MIPEQHERALRIIYNKLSGMDINWVITGSVSFCLQGVPLTPNDIDIQTDKGGAYKLENLFEERMTREVKFSSTDRIRSHFGAFELEDVEVEIMGAVQKFYDGRWEKPIDINRNKKFVEFSGMDLPVLALRYEARAYRRYGRIEMADKLDKYADLEDGV